MQGGEPVKIKATSGLVAALLQIGMAGNALAVSVYTDRTAFGLALASSTVENFEEYDSFDFAASNQPFVSPDPSFPNGLTSLTLNEFSLAATPRAIKIQDAPHSGSHNTTRTSGASQFLYLDTDDPGKVITGSTTVITLNNPADAFGFDYNGVFEPGTTFTVTIGSETFDLNLNDPEHDTLFWGVLGLGSFTDITLTTSLDSGYGVDDVIFGTAVPLPPAIWLFGSGLLALAGGARKSKAPG
jgi:hypothetical protein